MKNPNYRVLTTNREAMLIRDAGPWDKHPTVTNGVEHVVQDLWRGHGLRQRRLFYFDSEGELAEIIHDGPRFIEFKHAAPHGTDPSRARMKTALEEPQTLGTFSTDGENTSWTCTLDAIAGEDFNVSKVIKILSVVGPQTSIKAVGAILTGNSRVSMRAFYRDQGGAMQARECFRVDRYKLVRHRLAFDQWHLVAISEDPDLLTSFSRRALWHNLTGARFTTPLLKGWMPWLAKELLSENLLIRLGCFRCDAALLRCTSDQLDAVVSKGVREGHLRFE